MDFRSDMQKLTAQVIERKGYITNEEMTKQSLIIPFLQKLGYDVFNPLEVRPEFTADFGLKKGEKVDYAIFKNGVPIMLIEAKAVTEKLHKHDAQLSRYFNALPEVKIAILTNGVEYKFFTDLNQDNIMDAHPFFTFTMEGLTNADIETIESFTKDNFAADEIVRYAQELIYMTNLNATLKELFKNPSDDFLRFLIKDFSSTRITSNVLDRFRPIVKKAINNTLLEIISEGLSPKAIFENNSPAEEAPAAQPAVLVTEEEPISKGPVTTADELKVFEIISSILSENNRDITNLKYKDTISYFSVMERVITKWFLRIVLDGNSKYIFTRLQTDVAQQLCPGFVVAEGNKSQGPSKVLINDVEDVKNLQALIVACFDEVKEQVPTQ